MAEYTLYFDKGKTFDLRNIRSYKRIVGLYFIYNKEIRIRYPFSESKLIYIGMSEKQTNSIGSRLQGHFEGKTGNKGISNYGKVDNLHFTIMNFEMIKSVWPYKIETLESYFILDFVRNYGVYPICNNKTGFDVLDIDHKNDFVIEWEFFEK